MLKLGVHTRLADEDAVVSVDGAVKLDTVFIIWIQASMLGSDHSGVTNRGLVQDHNRVIMYG